MYLVEVVNYLNTSLSVYNTIKYHKYQQLVFQAKLCTQNLFKTIFSGQ